MTPVELCATLKKVFAGEDADLLAALADAVTEHDEREAPTPTELVTHLTTRPRPTVLHATHDDRSLAMLIEYVDGVTGLNALESWFFAFDGDRVARVTGVRGRRFPIKAEFAHRAVNPYLAGFGLRAARVDDVAVVRQAAAAVFSYLTREEPFEIEHALLNDDLVYIPICWIGCAGFLVERASWNPILLGSAMVLEVHVWAYYRGFADGQTPAACRNDLIITSIHDREATRRVLRRVVRSADLERLPLRVSNVDLYFLRSDFWKAELKGAFTFRIEPPSVDDE